MTVTAACDTPAIYGYLYRYIGGALLELSLNLRRELIGINQQGTTPRPLYVALAALAVGIFVGVMITQWSSYTPDNSPRLQRLRQAGVIRVGFANEAPFAFLDSKGHLTGESPEIARVIMKKMGIMRVEGVLTDFGSLITDLNAGRFDMIAAGMYITPTRQKEIAFSLPTYQTATSMLVRVSNPKNLHNYYDILHDSTAILAVTRGTVEEECARVIGVPNQRIFVVGDTDTGVNAIRSGYADAFAMTQITANYLAHRFNMTDMALTAPFSDIVGGKFQKNVGAFGFRFQDRDLLTEFNKHLAGFVGTQEHQDLVKPFGIDASAIPSFQSEAKAAAVGECPKQ